MCFPRGGYYKDMKLNIKNYGFVSVPVMAFSALVGLGLLGVAIFGNNDGLSLKNKGSLLAQVSQTFNVYRTLSICSSPNELTLSSTCQTDR